MAQRAVSHWGMGRKWCPRPDSESATNGDSCSSVTQWLMPAHHSISTIFLL